MNPYEHKTESPSNRTGRFATFLRLLGGHGSGAPSDCRLLLISLLSVALFFAVPAAQAVAATVTVTLGGTGTGTVTSSPAGIECSNAPGEEETTCSASFGFGVEVTLTAAGHSPYVFTGWAGNTAAEHCASGITNPCSMTVSFLAATTTAAFNPVPSRPSALTTGGDGITYYNAQMHGTINPEGSPVGDCRFEYGTTTAYGQATTCEPQELGEGTAGVAVHAGTATLKPDTQYHFRLVASNPGGTSFGEDKTFMTVAAPVDNCPNAAVRAEQGPLATLLPDCRAYEQVTPVFKNGGSIGGVNGFFYSTATNILDTTSLTDAGLSHPYTEGSPSFQIERTSRGWATSSLDPPTGDFLGGSARGIVAASEDGRATLWTLQTAEDAPYGAAFYVRHPDGTFVRVGPTVPAGNANTSVENGRNDAPGFVSGDLSHLVFSGAHAAENDGPRWPGDITHSGARSLWEYVGTENNSPLPVLVGNSGSWITECGGTNKGLSSGGSTVFFEAAKSCTEASGPPVNQLLARVDSGGPDAVTINLAGTASSATSEVQQVKVAADSGTFTLALSSQTTAPLAYNASDAVVESALDSLSTIGGVGGSVAITGGPGNASGSSPYVITFGGSLAGTDVAQISINPEGLGVGGGTTLTCSSTTTATTSEFRWLRNGAPIAGATGSTYTTESPADDGASIQCQVFKLNVNAGSTQVSNPQVISSPFPATAPPTAPATVVAPVATGALTVGSTPGGAVKLTCSPGTWTGSPTFGYQWYRNGVALSGNGAESQEYTVQAADLATAAVFQCAVTGTNAGGAATKVSQNKATTAAPSPVAPPSNTTSPVVTVATAPASGAETTTPGVPSCTTSAACRVTVAPTFAGVSEDGSKAFFTTTQTLTTEDQDTTADIYECDLPGDGGTPPVRNGLVDPCPSLHSITATGTATGANVQSVVAVSPDGSHVYFTARGVLTGEPNEFGQTPASGSLNLYAYQRDSEFPSGHITFIATVPVAPASPSVTPDGRYFVFLSTGDLTPDDTSTVAQVFRYDTRNGELVRVSVGEEGFDDDGNTNVNAATIASTVQHSAVVQGESPVSDDGSYIAFATEEALVPQDVNGSGDDYLWHEGRVSLITGGDTRGIVNINGGFPYVSRSGSDVFFSTKEPFSPLDRDENFDIYDARIDGGFVQPAPPAACQGETCLGSAESGGSPGHAASESFVGQRNPQRSPSCSLFGRRAHKLSGRAKTLRHHVRGARNSGIARRRRAKAGHLTRRAAKQHAKAKSCIGFERGTNR